MNTPDLIVRGASSPCPAPPRRAGERLPERRGRESFPRPVREPLFRRSLSRRDMLRLTGLGLGALALEFLVATEHAASAAAASSGTAAARSPHFVPQARAVILLMQNGGPSQMDLFDPKADLKKFDGKVHVEKVEMFQKGSEANKLLGSPFTFHRRGACGMEMSEVIPHLGSVADDLP